MAHHYREAGRNEDAIPYWRRAGENAIQRSANLEAIAHLTQGLTLLTTLPDTPTRQQQELDFQVLLGPALIAIRGQAAPDVERVYARARELCQQLCDTPQLFPVMRGLILSYHSRGDLQTSYQLAQELFCLAQAQSEPADLMLAHFMLGVVLFWQGDLAAAYGHHSQAIAIYDLPEHQTLALRHGLDIGVVSRGYLSLMLWQRGYPDQAIQFSQAAHTLAQEVSHPYSLVIARLFAAILHQFRREAAAACEQAEVATNLAQEQGFEWFVAWGMILHGWALAIQGQGKVTIAKMRQGLAAELATGSRVFQAYSLGLMAEAYGEGGQCETGLHLLSEALAVMAATEVRFCAAELNRLKGTLLIQQSNPDALQAEACFSQAIAIARAQQAKSLELRAATSLARLWQSQGKRQAAYDLLQPVYGWFTEGFDTADLKDAKALLQKLAG